MWRFYRRLDRQLSFSALPPCIAVRDDNCWLTAADWQHGCRWWQMLIDSRWLTTVDWQQRLSRHTAMDKHILPTTAAAAVTVAVAVSPTSKSIAQRAVWQGGDSSAVLTAVIAGRLRQAVDSRRMADPERPGIPTKLKRGKSATFFIDGTSYTIGKVHHGRAACRPHVGRIHDVYALNRPAFPKLLIAGTRGGVLMTIYGWYLGRYLLTRI